MSAEPSEVATRGRSVASVERRVDAIEAALDARGLEPAFHASHSRLSCEQALVRGHVGIVVGESPAYPFPDAHAHGVEAVDEPTYDVRFRSTDLWPNTADEALVHVGIFQSDLQRAA